MTPAPAWGRDARGFLFIRCACGLCLSLDEGHVIAANGEVSPSLHHDDVKPDGDHCGWHVYGTLEGFTP